jgi:RNA polymerase sigma factor for flagellar operon FliA
MIRQQNPYAPARDQVIVDYLPLVKRVASHMIAKLPASVRLDDLVQTGLIGLMEAADNFDSTQGAQFETYATQRIRGAMLDELRSIDWLPRSLRKNMRTIEAAIHKLQHKLGRAPGEQEVADAMGIPLQEYQQMLQDARGYQLLHFEDFSEDEDGEEGFLERHLADPRQGPLETLQDDGFRRKLIDAISTLPEREKLMMGLYYEEELNLREIGEVLGVSESRVCQLHSQAIARIRAKLKDWLA